MGDHRARIKDTGDTLLEISTRSLRKVASNVSLDGQNMNGVLTNGVDNPHINGISPGADPQAASHRTLEAAVVPQSGVKRAAIQSEAYVNGVNGEMQDAAMRSLANGIRQMPPEIQHITAEYLRLSSLVERAAYECWNGLEEMVDTLSQIALPAPSGPPQVKNQFSGTFQGDQSKQNLEKKDRILRFAQEHRETFIKILVLSQWGKSAKDIQKCVDLHSWLNSQRLHYTTTADFVGYMKRELALAQIPNPDLKTAWEVLSTGRISGFPDLGFSPEKFLKPKQVLKTLRHLNNILCSRLTLHESLPSAFQKFYIRNGRVTFSVESEFELDLSVADEDPASQFYFVDFRFTFRPCTEIPDGRLRSDIAARANAVLKLEGLQGCYEFLHDLTLSYKINILHKQAVDLVRGHWSENARIELIRRTLVVQYWTNRPSGNSWIEIGIRQRRKQDPTAATEFSNPHLHVRWMRENKEVGGSGIELNPSELSLEDVLHQVIASHTSLTLEGVYERLAASPLYREGDLSTELSTSDFSPNDCFLEVQLAAAKRVTIAIEPVSGSVILKPASALYGRAEFDLARCKTLVDALPQQILRLRCLTSDQDLLSNAISAGWEVASAFRPSQSELKAMFGTLPFRCCFIRQSSWTADYLLAATFGMEGDSYWLVHVKEPAQPPSTKRLGGFRKSVGSKEANQYFQKLAVYTSGMITLRVNTEYLGSLSVRTIQSRPSAAVEAFYVPTLSFEFQPAKLRSALDSSAMSIDWRLDPLNLPQSRSTQPDELRRTATVGFRGLDLHAREAVMLAKGRCDAAKRVLQHVRDAIEESAIDLNADSGEFSIRLLSRVGRPVLEQLFERLFQLETLTACVSVLQKHKSLVVNSVSPSQASFLYRQAPSTPLGAVITFATASDPLRLELTPDKSNPHIRIREHLTNHLATNARPLYSSLQSFVPMLTFTEPLLSVFDELASATKLATAALNLPHKAKSKPRLHILPRNAQHYGIQYFGPSHVAGPPIDGSPSGMLVRLEIVAHTKHGKMEWVLREALEELQSYTRKSYCSQALKDRLKADVFGRRGSGQAWMGYDKGAACEIDNPGPLLKKVNGVVETWVQEQIDANPQEADSKVDLAGGGVHDGSAKSITQSAIAGSHSQSQPQVTGGLVGKPGAVPPLDVGAVSGKPGPGIKGPQKGPQKKPQEVITLD